MQRTLMLFFCFLGGFCFFRQPLMDFEAPRLWGATIYRFREVISTQESKSIGSRVIKSPCGLWGIFLLSPHASLTFSPVRYLFLTFDLCQVSLFILHHTTTFPLSVYVSFPHTLPWLTSAPSYSLYLDRSSCFSGYHKALCQSKQFPITLIYSICQRQNEFIS